LVGRLPRKPGQAFGSASTLERQDTIASTDDIARQIATLKGRMTALDRERSEIAE